MKSIFVVIATVMFVVFTAGCNSSSNTTGTTGTSMQATWAVTGNLQCTPSCGLRTGSYQVALVPSPCSVDSPLGTFSVQGSVCFIANNNTGNGSIAGTGLPASSKNTSEGVLIGAPANPAPDGSTINLLFVAAASGSFAEFTGTGTVTNGKWTGTASCSADTPVCQGVSATFSANAQ